ncbi:MAG: methyl-accepting chemotaxis protein [Limnobacter sp.]|nr:methyl-accepting chemotaxis protein [Limnobacter sp.]
MNLSSQPLSRQISISSALIIGVIFVLLIGSIAWYAANSARDASDKNVSTQNTALVNQLEIAYDLSKESTKRLADLFQSWFAGELRIDANQTTKLGEKDAPAVFLGGNSITGNFQLVDRFTQSTGGVATVFAKTGDDFIRVSTSLKKENGDRAIGTFLDRKGAAYQTVVKGETYTGEAKLFGKFYMTQYVPVKSASGQFDVVLFVGFNIDALFAELSESVLATRVGDTGVPYVLRVKGTKAGETFIHQTLQGDQWQKLAAGNPELQTFLTDLGQKQSGIQELNWKTAEGKLKDEFAAYEVTQAWGGVAVVSPVAKDEVYAPVYKVIGLLVVSGLVAAVVMSLALAAIAGKLTSPSKTLTQLALRLGNGDLTARAADNICNTGKDSKNEMSLLARSMNRMADSMEVAVSAVKLNTHRVQDASEQLVQSSNELENGAAQESDAASGMASAVEQMSSSIASAGESASHTMEVSAKAKQLADDGLGAINSATIQMNKISQNVESTSEVIAQLGDQSRQISEIALIIKGIAEQTNLLALNAAIEAARAGEQGRGFSVVADEVRKLAERTRQSTDSIHGMIEGIQQSSDVAVKNMGDAVESVRLGVNLVEKAGQAMHQITSESQAVAGAIQNINDALGQQNQASDSISGQVEVVAQLSERNLSVARQAAQAVSGLKGIASDLTNVVSKFQVKNS